MNNQRCNQFLCEQKVLFSDYKGMMIKELTTIDNVISVLEEIILESEKNGDPLGYFAALYQRVTIKVKEGIENQFFEDGPRMEKLDIVFAKRYIDAYNAWHNNQPVTQSWNKAFTLAESGHFVVLQHLLMGMNAHINLDLGIAAAEVSPGEKISGLQNDFFKINDILASLVNEIQNNLSLIWPFLKKILSISGKIDNLLVEFSMEKARDGAWKSAKQLAKLSKAEINNYIETRDKKVANKSSIITNPGNFIKIIIWIILLGERGTVAEKIQKLRNSQS